MGDIWERVVRVGVIGVGVIGVVWWERVVDVVYELICEDVNVQARFCLMLIKVRSPLF